MNYTDALTLHRTSRLLLAVASVYLIIATIYLDQNDFIGAIIIMLIAFGASAHATVKLEQLTPLNPESTGDSQLTYRRLATLYWLACTAVMVLAASVKDNGQTLACVTLIAAVGLQFVPDTAQPVEPITRKKNS